MSSREESFLELSNELADRPLWLVIAETVVSAVILLTAFFGNLLVCWAVYRITILRQPRNYFIISLALSDVCMACLVMPFSFGVFASGRWSYGFIACQFQGVLCVVFGGVSLQTVTLTAVNRCMKMTQPPPQYLKVFNKNKTIIMLLMSWVMAWSIPISNLLIGENFKFHPGKTFCYVDFNNTPKSYSIVMFHGFVISPFAIMMFCYIKVYKTVRSHSNRITTAVSEGRLKASFEEIKITKLLFAIVLGFAICWSPFMVIDVVSVFKGDYALPRQVYVLYIIFVSSSSAINPVIYGVMNRQFRVAFTKSLGLSHLLRSNPTRLRTISVMTRNRGFIAGEENEDVGKKFQTTVITSSKTHARAVIQGEGTPSEARATTVRPKADPSS